MRTILFAGLAVFGLSACQTSEPVAVEPAPCLAQCQSEQFQQVSQQLIDDLWRLSPTWALYSGVYDYADQLVVPDADARARSLAFVAKWRKALDAFDNAPLTSNARTDKALLDNLLDSMEWEVTRFKAWQWNPAQYNVAGPFARLMNEEYADLDIRLKAVLGRMGNVSQFYAAARGNINNPTLEHTQLAILQNKGGLAVFSEEMLAKAKASGLSDADKALFEKRFLETRQSILSFIGYLESLEADLKANGARSFRIGEALYEEKFALDIQSGMTARQLYEKALADRAQAQKQMLSITEQLWPKYFPTKPIPRDGMKAVRTLIDHLSARHVKRDNFVAEVKAQIPELEAFVRQHDLITLDPNKPLVVRETPPYMRGFAGASISAPGPFDKDANTYYNVTPLDGMTEEQAESYLREYNHWILQILNIHEAIPGHYTQLVYSNESPSLVKSLFGNGAMVEGWAVYTERMMLEEGYGDFEMELWLMYWKWNLRVITNTIIDYEIQVLGADEAAIMDHLVNGAFQQHEEAAQKWRRATLSQVQLTSYYAGFREIYDFREDYKRVKGDAFDLKAFHEQFLSYGSAPVKFIRALMLEQAQ
ncbi:DUF885 domain-containing protein [Ferrimonas balearica]|uniref:DUF885 domain-containing protein n=1 Tax=Ferrimonas balearica TaxID=44012 RepID=UPI001C99E46E|nr:DUF885 domain-containing protein [Ferrimonas balearica]MBY5920924.1 DUF885 domain-containing protein [Ferrimonas balearica]MBY5996391.1 DUF885 domain-containing protein [Ferrimonas balearica]